MSGGESCDGPAGDHLAAATIAYEAGQLLLRLRAGGGSVPDLRAAGDRRSDDLIGRRIAQAFPSDAVLSEESPERGDRRASERVWIVDPLDGTREYGELGRDDWAVHVALAERGVLVAGAVALPAQGGLFSTLAPFPRHRRCPGPLRVVVSRSRPPRQAGRLHQALDWPGGIELVSMGSAGAKAMAVVRGEVDAYLHAGGLKEWDAAAPVAVAQASGLHASHLDGSPLAWNQPEVQVGDLLVCTPEVAPLLLEALARLGAVGVELVDPR